MSYPESSTCEKCKQPILLAKRRYGIAKLDPFPILPLGKCGYCDGWGKVRFHGNLLHPAGRHKQTGRMGDLYDRTMAGRTTGICADCNGTGERGERPGQAHLLLHAKTGIARAYSPKRECWEALHRPHQCETSPVRSETGSAKAQR